MKLLWQLHRPASAACRQLDERRHDSSCYVCSRAWRRHAWARSTRRAIDGLIDWMVDGARPSASAREIIDEHVQGAGCGRRADQSLRAVHLHAASQHDRLALHLDAREGRRRQQGPDGAVLDRAIYGQPAADRDREADIDPPAAGRSDVPARLRHRRRADRRRLHRLSGAADHLHDRRNQRGELVEQGRWRLQRRGSRWCWSGSTGRWRVSPKPIS